MANVVSQETFDAAVRENMEEFEMDAAEAVEDAVAQFEAQGVNLANIVQDLSLYTSGDGDGEPAKHAIVQALDDLTGALQIDDPDIQKFQDNLKTLRTECDIDLAHKLMAGKNGAYSILLQCCKKCEQDQKTYCNCLETLCSLFNGQPDLIENIGMSYFMEQLKKHQNEPEVAAQLVKLIRLTCVKHEGNRQAYVSEGLIPALVSTLDHHKREVEVVREVCVALRILVADDDVRVPFGKGHEHAKMIVTEEDALKKIMAICEDFKDNKAIMGELFSTLGRLAVRNEFCQEILDLGGLQLMLAALQHNMGHQQIVQRALGVMKPIAGNDQVKVAIAANSGIELILAAMIKHQKHAGIAEAGCAAMATVSLRQPEICKQVVHNGGAEVITKAMQLHPDSKGVQKQACMAIRNIVARTPELQASFLEQGAEALIQRALASHADAKDESKAALRDLGCKVELQELWKGEGRGITH